MTLDLPKTAIQTAPPGARAPDTVVQRLHRFQMWMETSHDVVAEVTLQGGLVYISPNVKTVLGYEPTEVTGRSILAPVHPEDLAQVQAKFVSPQGWGTCRYRHHDGSWRWIEASGRKFTAPDGEERIWLIVRDVTGRKLAEDERQKLEAQLRQSQKLEALGTLAGGIAHDFNNILAAIILSAELARLETAGQAEVQQRFEQILTAGNRAKILVQQILTFSRPQLQERQPIKLHAVISEALGLLRSTLPATIELRADVRDSSSQVLADPTQIHQVLMNLCINAAQAMTARPGRIDVQLDSFFVDSLYPRAQPKLREGAYVRLIVTDTGSGMDAATLKRIFEPYFTTKGEANGTGLGLATVSQIIKNHDGAIHVSSQPGEGTVFELLLPRHEACPVA